jgi:hypothetical protein
MKKTFILIFLLAGCNAADLKYKHWYKNGASPDEFSKTRYLCLHETGREYTFDFFDQHKDAFFVSCMNAHGFYLSKKDIEK